MSETVVRALLPPIPSIEVKTDKRNNTDWLYTKADEINVPDELDGRGRKRLRPNPAGKSRIFFGSREQAIRILQQFGFDPIFV